MVYRKQEKPIKQIQYMVKETKSGVKVGRICPFSMKNQENIGIDNENSNQTNGRFPDSYYPKKPYTIAALIGNRNEKNEKDF